MDLTVTYVVLLLLATLIGAGLSYWICQRKISVLTSQKVELSLKLKLDQRNQAQLDDVIRQAQQKLVNEFNALSDKALKSNSDDFLKLAEQNLKRFQSEAETALDSKEKSIQQLVKPINEALQKTTSQIHQIEKDRQKDYGSLLSTIDAMNKSQQDLKQETQNLVQALRRPEVRGQWGEMTLRRLAELSGMVAHCDFFEQAHTVIEKGAIRPDMIVKLPENREIIVDAKTPLDAYLSAMQAQDDDTRQRELKRHAQNIRKCVRNLSSKSYWAEYSGSLGFIVLFIPGEQFLSAALQIDTTLFEDSMRNNIILATPTNFMALLHVVSYGWKQQVLAENAMEIRDLGENLYKRLAVFSDHLHKLGKSLTSSVDHFNKSVSSLESRVMPSARKFLDMGIRSKDNIAELQPIEQQTRLVQAQREDE